MKEEEEKKEKVRKEKEKKEKNSRQRRSSEGNRSKERTGSGKRSWINLRREVKETKRLEKVTVKNPLVFCMNCWTEHDGISVSICMYRE